MAGPDSERFRATRRSVVRDRLNAGDHDANDEAQQISDNMRIAAGSVISWEPKPKLGGQVLEANPENALKLFKAIPWMFEQCFGVAINRSGFTKH
jgi:hypothetical protein